MRNLALLAVLCLPTFGATEERFGDWVASQLAGQPYFQQSIGWDMPDTFVTVTDPLSEAKTDVTFTQTPDSTAWVVGILNSDNEARLSGLALVWSDDPFDVVVTRELPHTQSGYVAFQTPDQTGDEALPEAIALQMIAASPGPILVEQPDDTRFPVGDGGVTDGCLQVSELYNDDSDLIALVVFFQSNGRTDTDTTACTQLSS